MKKMLFISNISNKITNFSIPSIYAGQQLGYEFHMAANYSGFSDDYSKYNVVLHHIDLSRNPLSIKNLKAFKQMIVLIKKENFEAIHCNTPIGGVLGRLCGKIAKVPKVIYTAHGFHFYKGAPLINRTVFKWAEMIMARFTDAIITINKEDYEAAKKFKLRDGGQVFYMPGVGIDTSLIKNAASKRGELLKEINADDSSVLLISVGELNKNKNHRIIIEALGRLKNPSIHYILCGNGDKKEELNLMASRLKIDKNVHFFGYRTDIPELLNSCDIFVMPSHREGLSRSLMEAMSAGLPCVVSDIRGNVDLIDEGKGGYLLNPDDIDGYANCIKVISENAELRTKMGACNSSKTFEYDVDNLKNEVLNIYSEIFI